MCISFGLTREARPGSFAAADLVLAVDAADGRGDRRPEGVWCALPQEGGCVHTRSSLVCL